MWLLRKALRWIKQRRFLEMIDIANSVSQFKKAQERFEKDLQQFQLDLKHQEENLQKINERAYEITHVHEQDIESFTAQSPWSAGFFNLPYSSHLIIFNPAVCRVHGVDYLVTRYTDVNTGRRPPFQLFSKIGVWELRGTAPVGSPIILPLPMGNSRKEQWEDPRVNVVERPDGTASIWVTCTNFIQGKGFAHQAMAVFDEKWRRKGINELEYGKNGKDLYSQRGHEKNWTWFFHEGKPHCVYTIQPSHKVLACNPTATAVEQEYETTKWNRLWRYGEARGGSNPIKVGDEYWAFFHSALPWWSHRRRYFMGAYAFEAKPPFTITRVSSHPILAGSLEDHDEVAKYYNFPLTVFPCGATFNDQEWLISMGINDTRSGWIKIPHEELIETVRRLK